MDQTRTIGRVLVSLAMLLLLPSCASGPPPGPSEAELTGAAAKSILISPFNIVSSLPPELEGSTNTVSDAIREHLEAHGKTVQIIAFRAGRDLWQASIQEVRESGATRNFDNAARVYARKLAEHVDFDAVIVPSLFVQNAKMKFGTIRWDGAEQPIEIRGGTGGSMYVGQRFSLNVRAASLFLVILDSEGNTVHETRRGLEPIQHIEMVARKEGQYSGQESVTQQLVDDVPAIQDDAAVREGVAAALFPFVPQEVPARAAAPAEVDAGAE